MAHLYQPLPPTPATQSTPSRPSKRAPVPEILSSFPAPPSHIPPTPVPNPPPTGPPSTPLPPLPSVPSRISEHEQLLLLSSIARRSIKYSQRDSILNGNRDSVASMGRPPISNNTGMSPSDFSHSETEPALCSPRLPRLHRQHQANDSISSIDMHDVLGVFKDDFDDVYPCHSPRARPRRQSTARHPEYVQSDSLADPIDPHMVLHSEDLPPATPLSPSKRSPITVDYYSHRSLSESYRLGHARSTSTVTTVVPVGPGSPSTPTQNHTRSLSNSSTALGGHGGLSLELDFSMPIPTSECSSISTSANAVSNITDSYSTTTQFSAATSSSLMFDFAHKNGRREEHSGSGAREDEPDMDNPALLPHLSQFGLGSIVVTKTTSITSTRRGSDQMTLDELGIPPACSGTQLPISTRVASPDIATILSITPRPALSRSATRSKSRPTSRAAPGQRRVVSISTTNTIHRNRRRSEGAPTIRPHAKNPSVHLHKHADGAGTTGVPPSTKMSLSRSMSATTCRSSGSSYYEDAEDGGYYDEALERVLEGRGSEDEEDAVALESAARDKPRGRWSREDKMGEDGGGDSDSSLDLHTPLPHLMLRHGLLSPHSKLLPQADCSRAATPSDGRPGSILSLASNRSVMTKSGIIKDERDTITRRVRHRDGKLLRGGIGLTTGLGWSDSEDEDAPSPLTRRLSTLNLSRRSSASSIHSANFPLPSSAFSSRRLHPLSRSYSSGAILETEREHDSYSYTHDDEDEEEEDHTLEESGKWAQRHRLSSKTSSSSPPVSWQRRPPTTRRRKHGALGTKISTSSVGSTFSLEVTIPQGDKERNEKERPKTPSRLRRPSSHASMRSTTVGTGGRDSSGSSSLDHRSSGLSSFSLNLNQRRSGGDDHNPNWNTPPSTASTLSIPMPATPQDIFDPASPPLFSSTRGMLNKEKSLPPLPAGGLRKASGILQRSLISNGASSATAAALSGTGKYAFPSTRVRTFSSTSTLTSSPPLNMTFTATAPVVVGSSSILPSCSSVATIKPHVRPLQLPRQATSRIGDRPAVPVPSPSIPSSPLLSPPNSAPATTSGPVFVFTSTNKNLLRSPTLSVGTTSVPNSPMVSSFNSNPNTGGTNATTTTGIARPKPRTGTGMVYRTSSSGNSKMRTPMILSTSSSIVSSGGGGVGNGSNGIPAAIAL